VSHGRARRRAALAWLAGLALGIPAHAQETGLAAPAAPTPAAVVSATGPPFWVAGVILGADRRSAVLVPLDEARRELGVVTLHEGQRYDGYRVVAVERDRVLLEASGTVVSLGIGRPSAGPDAAGPVTRGPIFIPGPDKPKPDLEYTGRQAPRGVALPAGVGERAPDGEHLRDFVERVFGHPQVQQQIEEIRPLIRQKLEGATAPSP
jgi:hypothetical protein